MEKVEEVEEVHPPVQFAPLITNNKNVARSAFVKPVNPVETPDVNTNNPRNIQIEYDRKLAEQLATETTGNVSQSATSSAAVATTSTTKPKRRIIRLQNSSSR